ncbi:MAG: hypothetical protein II156_06775 [Lachnospiraceae bacterium]|jgi:hypothetical protein|nr:hypothetical protein [Lachnospiraceae bacterium]
MRNRKKGNRKTILTLIGFAAVMILFLVSVHFASSGNTDRQRQSLEKAIQRDVTYCYATTGRYPKTLDYIERVYGLTYDKELFKVDYEIVGSKIPPTVTITQTEGAK